MAFEPPQGICQFCVSTGGPGAFVVSLRVGPYFFLTLAVDLFGLCKHVFLVVSGWCWCVLAGLHAGSSLESSLPIFPEPYLLLLPSLSCGDCGGAEAAARRL